MTIECPVPSVLEQIEAALAEHLMRKGYRRRSENTVAGRGSNDVPSRNPNIHEDEPRNQFSEAADTLAFFCFSPTSIAAGDKQEDLMSFFEIESIVNAGGDSGPQNMAPILDDATPILDGDSNTTAVLEPQRDGWALYSSIYCPSFSKWSQVIFEYYAGIRWLV